MICSKKDLREYMEADKTQLARGGAFQALLITYGAMKDF
jgi:hypothetical protein